MTSEQVLQAIKKAVDKHEPAHGLIQWYVDEVGIDCDAEEFWEVVGSELARLIDRGEFDGPDRVPDRPAE